MALNYTNFSKNVLTQLANGGSMTFSTPHIAIFTTMPGTDGTGFVEASYPEYARVKANVTGIEGNKIMGTPTSETGTGDDAGKTIAVIKNQEYIYFPVDETGTKETIVGFGLFSAATGGQPYLWAPFAEAKEINANTVPTFLKSDFTLRLK